MSNFILQNMKKILKSLPIYLIPAYCILFNACIDDPVNPFGNKASATLYNNDGSILIDLSEIYLVSPGNYPITQFSPPYFRINTFSSSYDLVVNTYWNFYTVKYAGLSSNSTNIVFEDPRYENTSNHPIEYFIIVPPEQSEAGVYFYKFITDANCTSKSGSYQLNHGDSLIRCFIELPYLSREPVSGEIIIFKSKDYPSANIDFRNFGYKKIDSLNDYSIIKFTEEELTYDIPETSVHFRNITPAGRNGRISSVKLCFYPLEPKNELTLYQNVYNEGDFTIPILPMENKIKLTGSYDGGSYWNEGFAYKYVQIGENAEIVHKEPISLVDPPEGDSNINSSTVFRINDPESGGVFMYEFIKVSSYEHAILRIFSQSKELSFNDVFCRGFEYTPNMIYRWSVIKYSEFSGIDDFVSIPFTMNPKYNSVQASQRRTFYTR